MRRTIPTALLAAALLCGSGGTVRAQRQIDVAECYHTVAEHQFIFKLRYYLPRVHGLGWIRPADDTRDVFTRDRMPFAELQRGAIVVLDIPSKGVQIPVGVRISEFNDVNTWILDSGTVAAVAAVTNLVSTPAVLPPDAVVFRIVVGAQNVAPYPAGLSDLSPYDTVGGVPVRATP